MRFYLINLSVLGAGVGNWNKYQSELGVRMRNFELGEILGFETMI